MSYGVLIIIENVLATDAPTLAQSNTIPEGLLLFRALHTMFRVSLSTLEVEVDIAKRFLLFAGVSPNEYDRLLSPLEKESPTKALRRHIAFAREANDLAYVVSADPTLAKRCIAWGVTPMLCPHPHYAAPSFLPTAGQGKLNWADMEESLIEQKFLRESDTRKEEDIIDE